MNKIYSAFKKPKKKTWWMRGVRAQFVYVFIAKRLWMSFIADKYVLCWVPASLWRLRMIDVGSGADASRHSLAGTHFHARKQLLVSPFKTSTRLKSLQELLFAWKMCCKMPLDLMGFII